MAATPGLDIWKQRQVLLSALTLPKVDGEAEDEYIDRIMADSREQGKKAAELGTKIHGALERHYLGHIVPAEYLLHVAGTIAAINERFGPEAWSAEKSFCTGQYGGKVDLHNDTIVIDFKTKEFGPDNLPKPFDEQIMQLAAYRHGLGYPMARCANVYVSVSNPGLAHIVEHSEEDLIRGQEMFSNLLRYWKEKNSFFKLVEGKRFI